MNPEMLRALAMDLLSRGIKLAPGHHLPVEHDFDESVFDERLDSVRDDSPGDGRVRGLGADGRPRRWLGRGELRSSGKYCG